MTTRDSRSSGGERPAQGGGRDPTQSLSLDDELEDDGPADRPSAHPSLALGTHEARRDERTQVASPQARGKPSSPPAPARPPPLPRPAEDPDQRLGAMLGSYRVLEVLGKGGMGFVYRAEHVKLGREVALKLLRADYAQRKDAVARFIQEARTVNRVRHRNIVDVPDILELEDGTTIIVMEFLRGSSLGTWARQGIDLPRALAVLVQICDGLSAAHAVSVVHRDLKPDNVIVVPTSDGAELVKLLDFGVAKLLNRDDEDVGFQTAAGSVIGTPAYMSPEQAGGMAIDARSDIYSLGAIMYELFCGQPMFRGRSFGEYVRKHLTELPVRPRETPGGAHLDERIEAVILRCLEKDPDHRFPSILEVRDALLYLLGGLETHPPTQASLAASGLRGQPQLPHPTHAPGAPSSQASSYHPPSYGGHSGSIYPPEPVTTPWWVWLVGGTVAVGLGVGAAVWYAGRGQAPTEEASLEPAPAVTSASSAAMAKALDDTPTPPAEAARLPLAFKVTPEGATVYAVSPDGSTMFVCANGCNYDLVLGPDGARGERRFVVKQDGHQEAQITVDLAHPQAAYEVSLSKLEAPSAVIDGGHRPAGLRRPATGKPTGKPTGEPTGEPTGKPTGEPTGKPTGEPSPVVPVPTPDKKPRDKIDRADTLDPFTTPTR